MDTNCYIINQGEIVILQNLSSNEYNGVIATVEGVNGQRIAVKMFHNKQQILVKYENLLEAGENMIEDDNDDDYYKDDDEDDHDYDSDGNVIFESTDIDMQLDEYSNNKIKKENDDECAFSQLEEAYALLLTEDLQNAMTILETTASNSVNYINGLQHAKDLCLSTIGQQPYNWLAHQILGDTWILLGNNNREAVESYKLQLDIIRQTFPYPYSSAVIGIRFKILSKIATTMKYMNDSEGELETLKQISMDDSTNAQAVANIGAHLLDSGDTHAALCCFRQAVIMDHLWALGRFHLARALMSNSNIEEAIKELTIGVTSCTSKKGDVKTFMMIARMLDSISPPTSSNIDVILKSLLRSIHLLKMPQDIASNLSNEEKENHLKLAALVYYQLGQALEKKGDVLKANVSGYLDGAVSAYKKSCELDNNDCSYLLALGNALRVRAHSKKSKDDLNDSIIVYQSGILVDPGNTLKK